MTTIFEARDLSKQFGGVHVINRVNLRIDRGDIRCLVGPNGAGKSTLFRLIIGECRASGGAAFFAGQEITRLPVYRRIRLGMSIKFQTPRVFPGTSIEENLRVALQRQRGDAARLTDMLRLIGLEALRSTRAEDLSHGQLQWLEIGMALSLNPSFLMLDEPTAGMSGAETRRVGEFLQLLNAQGTTIVVIDHDMEFVKQIATSVTVLHLGQIFAEGTVTEILANSEVARIYLGVEQ